MEMGMYRLAGLAEFTYCRTTNLGDIWWQVFLGVAVALLGAVFVFGIAFVSSWIDDRWKRRKRRR